MKYNIVHITQYRYSDMVTLCHNHVHLVPREFARQHCERWDLDVSPRPAIERPWTDAFGNPALYFTIEEQHHELCVSARSEVTVHGGSDTPPEAPAWERVAALVAQPRDPQLLEASQFVYDSPHVRRSDEAQRYAQPSFTRGRPLDEAVLDLTSRIHADFRYDPSATKVGTPTSEILARGRGVCQDFAHLEIACLRSIGLPARYVSGYLVTSPPPGRPRLVGADASHAWAAVYFPGTGWVEFDPTNNRLASDEHIVLAWGRDYSDVCPIKGVFLGGGAHTIAVSVDVTPKTDSPPTISRQI